MRKMREIKGYMTVEASIIFPIAFVVLLLFLGFGMYFLNVGITQGVVQNRMEQASEGALMGANMETGKLSYANLNNRNLLTQMYPGKKSRGTTAASKIKKDLSGTLVIGKVTSLNVTAKALAMNVDIKESLNVPGVGWMNNFGIHTFTSQEKGRYVYQGDMEQIRRWCAIYEAMD